MAQNNQKDHKLFLLDAMALIFRSHYAFIRNPRVTSTGLNTSAIFGFTNSLLEILEKENPTHISICFDTSKPTFRQEMYEEYKSNREEPPEDIEIAIPMVKKMADAYKIPTIEKPGYEADDIMGTLAKKADSEGFDVYLMTPDKDFAQLVEDHIYLYKPSRKSKPSEVWDLNKVKEEFGIEDPGQVVDIQGLMGDDVDNIPGVPGIGPKTATKLIKQYGSVENLLEHTDELKGKQKEIIQNHAEEAKISKTLATIYKDVPLDLDPKELKREEPDYKALKHLFAELEFRSIGKRVFGDSFELQEARKEEGVQGDLFTNEPDGKKATDQPTFKTLNDVDHDYQLIDTQEKRAEVVKELKNSKEFAIDTETSGLNPHFAELVGISISLKPHQGYYIPAGKTKEQTQLILNEFKPALEDDEIEKIGQNIKYDIQVLRNAGTELKGSILDTMIAHYLLEPELRHGLDYLSQNYLNYAPLSIESLIGKKGKNQGNMQNLDPAEIKDYACEDSDITLQLKAIFKPEIEKNKYTSLYEDVEAPLIRVLADMEYEGVKIDVQRLKNYSRELEKEIRQLEKEIHEMSGTQFNINSPKQLGEVLFEQLKIDTKARKTQKSKQYSTSEEVLTRLAQEHDIAQKVLDYRSVQKLKSTYVDALPDLVNSNTGRIHTSYQQAVTATGRLSSTDPNLQNIPIRTEKGRYIRQAFIPTNEDFTILSADYSQIELRLVADISKDDDMVRAFTEGQDIHTSTAAKIYKVALDQVTSEMRRQAKTVNFGIVYGISAYGLSQRLSISRKEASTLIENYFEEFPKIREYMDEQINFARKYGYVKTLLGRKRHLRDINSNNSTQRGFAERNAINTPIQGTAADMIKVAMVNIHQAMQAYQFNSKMILQIHDELIFDAQKDELEDLKPLVEQQMLNALTLDVPLEVEMGSGKNWLEAH